MKINYVNLLKTLGLIVLVAAVSAALLPFPLSSIASFGGGFYIGTKFPILQAS